MEDKNINLLDIESNFSAWLNLSIILLTASLLFYHMSNANTIKVPKKMAGIISCGLIIINIIITINSIVPYFTRTYDKNIHSKEKIYRNVYFYSSIIFLLIEFLICIYIIKDSLSN
jgi:hypothetical protein